MVGAIALVAGADLPTAARLAVSMTFLQFAIGVVNDVVDAPADADRLPPKAVPAGWIDPPSALLLAAACALAGLALPPHRGLLTISLVLVVLAIGFAYDLAFKGTAWSWLPFAVGIPVLPIYGWVGTTGSMPGFFAILIPMAVLAGAALAIANARADLAADRAAGTASIATRLGEGRSWWAGAALLAAATAIGVVFVGRDGWTAGTMALVIAGTGLVAVGLAVGRWPTRAARRRAWEAQAVGAAIAAVGWLAAMVAIG